LMKQFISAVAGNVTKEKPTPEPKEEPSVDELADGFEG
jgi:hypothetical protein